MENHHVHHVRNASCRDLSNADTEKPTRFIHRWQTDPENDLKNIFIHTGAEYFGPFEVKFLRCTLKRWCCYLTCLTTIAVNIEIAQSLDTVSCLAAVTKFIARCGCPSTIISDNGTNFVEAANKLKVFMNEWEKATIESYLAREKDCLEIQSSWSPSLCWNLG